jgi:hypothetical protein
MSELVFCEQCGRQIAATAKFCRNCGAAQEIVASGGEERSENVPTGAASAPIAVGPGADAASIDLGEKIDSLRRVTEHELELRANAAFPGRSWQQVGGAAIGGGIAAFVAAWGITWAILRVLGGDQAVGMLPLDQIARFGINLSLGAPLIISGNISSLGGETELRLPLTLLVLIPLAGLAIGGYLAAGWFRPASRAEGWKIGATIAVPFALILFVFGVSFAADVPILAPSFDGSEFGIGGSSASAEIHAAAFYTVLYGLFWGVLGGAFGGWLQARGSSPPGDPRAALVRTYGSSSPTVVIESAVRALGIPLLGFVALATIGCVLLAVSEGSGGLLSLLLVPTLAIAALFGAQGIGYEVEGYLTLGGLAGDTTQSTFHVWSNPIALLIAAALSLLVIVGLLRGGRRIAHASAAVDSGGAIRAGAAIAFPWVALLLILRGLGSLTLTATGVGIVQGAGKIDPVLGETILFGALFGIACGGFGGWLGWRERLIVAGEGDARDPVTTPIARRVLGDIDAELPEVVPGPLLPSTPVVPVPEGDQAAPPVPSPAAPPPPAPDPFCDSCGNAMAPQDRFCDRCGQARPMATG